MVTIMIAAITVVIIIVLIADTIVTTDGIINHAMGIITITTHPAITIHASIQGIIIPIANHTVMPIATAIEIVVAEFVQRPVTHLTIMKTVTAPDTKTTSTVTSAY